MVMAPTMTIPSLAEAKWARKETTGPSQVNKGLTNSSLVGYFYHSLSLIGSVCALPREWREIRLKTTSRVTSGERWRNYIQITSSIWSVTLCRPSPHQRQALRFRREKMPSKRYAIQKTDPQMTSKQLIRDMDTFEGKEDLEIDEKQVLEYES